MTRFPDRRAAGLRLGEQLSRREWHEPVVLGIARGGVVVAQAVAEVLHAPWEVVVARKIGAPGHPEFGVGAVTASGDTVYEGHALRALGLTPEALRETRGAEQAEARRRENVYLGGRNPLACGGCDVLLVDDGLATGVTARAAARSIRREGPRRLVFAAPVTAKDADAGEVDEVISVVQPANFRAVGEWYADFRPTSDDEVLALLGVTVR
ncbi:phosphoribosyltransferase [Amycolatopsis sp.]|uniref:phosphoribosyltransferase n=1 Tax=Amycolatopsis sp. TaxID=37632 RepID=UPI002BDC9AEB|nr:phosphoribosyltransferase family protein [Amycolatopsis sp.]HVV11165.1 phosphoribosyltransferase family protein [Amycolatopsis sp.]